MPLPAATVADPASQQNFEWLLARVQEALAQRTVSGRCSTLSGGSGDGWTAVHNATGDVTITFSPAFGSAPAVVAMPCESAGAISMKGYDGVPFTASTARLLAYSPDSPFGPVDTVFTFVATGVA